MTDNPQPWQPGTPPPPPTNTQQPYAGQAGQPGDVPPQGGWQQSTPPQGGWQQSTPPQGGWQGQPQGGWQGQQGYGGQPVDGEERTWMILAHISAPIALILSWGWLSILGPLIVWFLKKDSSPKVRQAAAGAFNFNLAFWLMAVIGWICFFTIILIPIAIVLWVIVFVVAAYAHLRGAWLASKGQVYNYPFQIRILS